MKIASVLNCSPYLTGVLTATSYVTLIFYTRTFSNTMESFFLAILLVNIIAYINQCTDSNSKLEEIKKSQQSNDKEVGEDNSESSESNILQTNNQSKSTDNYPGNNYCSC